MVDQSDRDLGTADVDTKNRRAGFVNFAHWLAAVVAGEPAKRTRIVLIS